MLGRLHLPDRMVHLQTGCGDYPDVGSGKSGKFIAWPVVEGL